MTAALHGAAVFCFAQGQLRNLKAPALRLAEDGASQERIMS